MAGHLESLINQRDRDVQLAMADYQADGASEEYAGKEQRWHNIANEVRGIIQVLRSSLGSNDETAAQSLQRPRQRSTTSADASRETTMTGYRIDPNGVKQY